MEWFTARNFITVIYILPPPSLCWSLNDHPVKLLINVSEPYFPKVTKGMTVKVKFDVYGDEEFRRKS